MHVTEDDRTSGRLTKFLLDGKNLFDQYRDEQAQSTDSWLPTATRRSRTRKALIAVLVTTLALLVSAGILALRRGRRLRHTVADRSVGCWRPSESWAPATFPRVRRRPGSSSWTRWAPPWTACHRPAAGR